MKRITLYTFLAATLGMLTFFSCVKKDFDNPPDTTNVDPKLPVNKTIWDLKQMYVANGGVIPLKITDDIIIAGVVVADDRGGNFYKQVVIQDESSGIPVLINRNNLYNEFPIGRKLYIKCKGLYLGAYGGLIQLGSEPDQSGSISDIPYVFINNHVVRGPFDLNQVKPISVTINQLLNLNSSLQYLSTLIQLDSVEFVGSDVNVVYAQAPTTSSATERKIEDCASNNIILRTSGYCNFRTALTPSGKGQLLAIYSRYNNTAQLAIRDTNDVRFTAERCNVLATLYNIRDIRNLYPGSGSVPIGGGYKIKGVVISDKANGNINSQNIVVQDATAGIVVRFASSSGLPSLNDEVEIDISGSTISLFNGVMQVGNLQTSRFVKTGTGSVTPRVSSVQQLLDSIQVWESTLIKVNNATFTATGTFSGNKTFTDGTATITHFAFSAATFATTNLPTTPKNITGILGQYTTSTSSTKQVSIRNLNDIE